MSILFLLTGCQEKQEGITEQKIIKQVYIQTIDQSAYSDQLTVSGNIVPTQTVKVSFKIPGIVSHVVVNEGDTVHKGDTIAKLDQEDYLIQVKADEAQVKAARLQIETEIPAQINQSKAQYELTKTTYERIKTLVEKGAVSQSQLDEISAKLVVDKNTYDQAIGAKEIAQSKLEVAQSELDFANANIQDMILYSPIEGIVLQKMVEDQETISEGYPVVVIGQTGKVWAQIGVTDEYINALHQGQKAKVYIYGIDRWVEGSIDEITSLADEKTRTFPVKIDLDNSKGEFRPGMICKAEIPLKDSKKILIPISSVIHLAAGSAVYTYSDNTKTVEKRMIETGEIVNDQIEVVKGLKFGEKIVVQGQFVIHDEDVVAAEEMKR